MEKNRETDEMGRIVDFNDQKYWISDDRRRILSVSHVISGTKYSETDKHVPINNRCKGGAVISGHDKQEGKTPEMQIPTNSIKALNLLKILDTQVEKGVEGLQKAK